MYERFDPEPEGRPKPPAIHSLVIRPAVVTDLEVIGALLAGYYGGDPAQRAAKFRERLSSAEARDTQPVFAADTDGGVVGFGATRYLVAGDPEEWGDGPSGWYLTGLVVDPQFRRFGVGVRLTEARLRAIRSVARFAYYIANAKNPVSIALHDRFGFVEIARGPVLAGVRFGGGEGILFRGELVSEGGVGTERGSQESDGTGETGLEDA